MAVEAGKDYERTRGAACAPLPARYVPREPGGTLLHRVVREHLETFLSFASSSDDARPLPQYIERTFRAFLSCGVLSFGFVRLRCTAPGCGHELLVPFSCKRRGVCPSCNARRMHDVSLHLEEKVLPRAPYRQWVLSLPFTLRYLLARDGRLQRDVLGVLLSAVKRHYLRAASARGLKGAQFGAVSFPQRFGSALNLNVHFHCLLLEGVYVPGPDGKPVLVPLEGPSEAEVRQVLARVRRRLDKLLAARGLDAPAEPSSPLERTLATALHLPLPGLGQEAPPPPPPSRLCAVEGRYTLHANVALAPADRHGLSRLLRYCLRPAFSADRLELTDRGTVRYFFRKPRRDGKDHVELKPVEFLARLSALIPLPRAHLVTYSGVFAPAARWRRHVVPAQPAIQAAERPPTRAQQPRVPWAELLKRTFATDVLRCAVCQAQVRVVAVLRSPSVVTKILEHLGLAATRPRTHPPRPPPQRSFAGFGRRRPRDTGPPDGAGVDPPWQDEVHAHA